MNLRDCIGCWVSSLARPLEWQSFYTAVPFNLFLIRNVSAHQIGPHKDIIMIMMKINIDKQKTFLCTEHYYEKAGLWLSYLLPASKDIFIPWFLQMKETEPISKWSFMLYEMKIIWLQSMNSSEVKSEVQWVEFLHKVNLDLIHFIWYGSLNPPELIPKYRCKLWAQSLSLSLTLTIRRSPKSKQCKGKSLNFSILPTIQNYGDRTILKSHNYQETPVLVISLLFWVKLR